ncbi:MAG TPA: ABC transporter ATP-binding protein [Mycobacteriales bacterium]|nr:ABC transporter ATP-binding protein [Mycobacteriales bacterium]
MATLDLAGINKTYGKKTRALVDVDLSVDDGEFFVILGPSGAGKTTTLKCIAGLEEIDSGRVRIGAQDMAGIEPYHRGVAMAFESYALYPQKTVLENLASPLRSGRTGDYSAAQQQERIDSVTETLGIKELQQRFPRELSNGQRQRVALGRVLVRPAGIYLLDEPLSHLDAKLRATMRAELKALGSMSSTTTVYVTHDYQEALALGDRIAVLREGRVVQISSPQEIWNDPVDTFVARALGQPEMNLIDVTVENSRLSTVDGALRVPVPDGLNLPAEARLGVRPRDVSLRAVDSGLEWDGRVLLAERLGRLVELTVVVGDTEIVAVVGSDEAPGEGEQVRLWIAPRSVHVFTAERPYGRRIGALGGGDRG